jgi:S-disulfanyl-L-cysteine oxidoreductase SoxD
MRLGPLASVPSVLALALTFAACGGSSAEPAEPTSTATEPAAAASELSPVEEQAKRGGELYGTHCASCHGNAGQGGEKAPPVVGAGVLPEKPRPGAVRNVEFKTALDVFTWVKASMPPTAPGSLADEEYVAILAFALKANGVTLQRPLDGSLAAELKLH